MNINFVRSDYEVTAQLLCWNVTKDSFNGTFMQPIKHPKKHVYLKITAFCDRFWSSVMVTVVSISSVTSFKQIAASNSTTFRWAGLAMNLSQGTSPHQEFTRKTLKTQITPPFIYVYHTFIPVQARHVYTALSIWTKPLCPYNVLWYSIYKR